jgi:phage terminase large subunit-like protein
MSSLRVDPDRLASLPPEEQERVRDQLAQLEQAFRRNPLLRYQPHRKQQEFHRLPAPPTRAFFGGNRSGKSTATIVDSIIQAVDRDILPEHLEGYKRWEPPFYCRVVTPDLTNTLDGVILQKFREWCPKSQLRGGSFDRAYDKVQRTLWFRNGSWFQFFSNDQDLDKFGGAALHRVVYDEEPRQDIRRESLMRLIDYGGEELFGMTPLNGMSWVFDELYEPWERGRLPADEGRIVVVDMEDNPHLDRVTMQRVLGGLALEEREARKSGRFVSFAGLIYPQFRPDRHIVPVQEVPGAVEVFCGIDPGFRHMTGVVFCFLDAQDRLVVFDELACRQQTIRQVCDQIRATCKKWDVRPNWFVIDPASRNKNNQTGRSDAQEFHDNGITTIPGQNAVGAGINRVKERLDADKLLIAAHCSELHGEFRRYRWVKDTTRREDASPDKPVKKDDHLLDALRYVVMQRPLRPTAEAWEQTLTFKDRMLRHALRALDRGSPSSPPDHPSGDIYS